MTAAINPADAVLDAVARAALVLVSEGATVGLGTGRAAAAFIAALGARARQGFVVAGVPTSLAAAAQGRAAGIPLVDLEEGRELELTVDGADEVAPNLDVLKGRGGAFVRERIVAAASRRQVILVGHDKLVPALGTRGGVPVEIIAMAEGLVSRRLKMLGVRPTPRLIPDGAGRFVTENGNWILDCVLPGPLDGRDVPRQIDAAIREIPGVVDTGLFLGTVERVLVGYPDGRVETLIQPAPHGDAGGD